MLIAMTGANGLLGRNLLLEIIKQNYKNLSDLEVFVFGRSTNSETLHKRIIGILSEEAFDYINDKDVEKDELIKILSEKIKCFEFNLGEPSNKVSEDDLKKLSSKEIDFFFHVASLTDFRDGELVKARLEKTNIIGTNQVLESLPKMNIKEFAHVSSAYVCGAKSGKVDPNYIDFNQKFRNPYEMTKLKAEHNVRTFCSKNSIKFKIFRPSTICGRLIENRIGATPKFDVFYSWAAFFLRYKEKVLAGKSDVFDTPIDVSLRFYFSPTGGLNIVPVDFVAKFIYQASIQQNRNQSYHICNDEEVPHELYTSLMLKTVNVNGVKNVYSRPTDLNQFEAFYYKTVGKIFTPYITQDPILFDLNSTREVCANANLFCPKIDEAAFTEIMKYAKTKSFGGFNIKKESLNTV
ncbi:MAG: NAD-dependent epimerase/dehydratase family protein [Proteobacteria bacterium]|nr:NAD-dependent epimerase/dehydratase family protein [Pseudomonadota bacterium]